jgi:hypothetical protein
VTFLTRGGPLGDGRLGEIGAVERESDENDHGRCAEKLDTVEMEFFADLVENMMRYCPEERLTVSVIVSHLICGAHLSNA